jgi:hypothetical protein
MVRRCIPARLLLEEGSRAACLSVRPRDKRDDPCAEFRQSGMRFLRRLRQVSKGETNQGCFDAHAQMPQ